MKKKHVKILIIVGVVFVLLAMVLSCFFVVPYIIKKQKDKENERLYKEYYESMLSLYEAENEKFSDFEVDVAFLGDSLTAGYDLEKYYPQYLTVNRGIGGDTTYGLESRLQISLFDLRPKVAVILIGGNNLNSMLENYERMIVSIKNELPETKIILASLTAMGGSWAHKNQIATYNNVAIKKLASKYDFSFVDLFYPLFDGETGEICAKYTIDGAHLTEAGYEVLTSELAPAIEDALNKANI